jgi:hypothetical protein
MKRFFVILAGLIFVGVGVSIFSSNLNGWEQVAAGALVLFGAIATVCGLSLSGTRLNSLFEALIRGLP